MNDTDKTLESARETRGETVPPSSDLRLETLLDGIVDYAIYLIDCDGLVRVWNSGAERVSGHTRSDIIGRDIEAIYTPEDRAQGVPRRAREEAVRDGRHESEGWRLRKDGTRFWAIDLIDPVRDARGEVIAYAHVMQDATGRRAAREALRLSEERFRILVNGVTDYAIYMLDPDGYITNWNRGGERIMGYAAHEIIGKHYSTSFTEEDRAAGVPQRALETAARDGRYEAEGWRMRKDGTRFWASVIVDRLRNGRGDIIGFAKITRDITERLRTQEALQRSQEELAQAQKMEAVGQLTGGIAHDFNNLLTIIATNADLLAQTASGDIEQRRLIDSIQRATDRGAKLTQQLLAFARRQPLRPVTQSIRSLVGNFEAMMRRGANDLVDLEFDLSEQPDLAAIDASQFEAAILNIDVNARDALPDGGKVRIRTRVVELDAAGLVKPGMRAGRYVAIAVEDSGTGMSPETLARACEPFFTTKEAGKGSGLGLSQVYGFVSQSGGFVTIDSTLGAGTTVTLYLPHVAHPRMDGTLETTRVATVLVVEDDPDVLHAAISMLNSLGYHVLTAGDASSALATLRRPQQIDVLFT